MGYFTDYPKHVFLILSNEFCERFSYYGMKAILVIYLNLALGFSEGTSVSIYHTFNVLCYFTPLLGAMIADGWLGKYKTILYVSIIYVFGNIVMTVTAIPINGEFVVWSPFIGLVIIAFGTGGIKPCVSAFGGDQFSETQQRQKDSFFSLFYMAINIGSLLSTIITPLIRSNVECFDQECYAVAFGIPAILMIVAIVLFVAGTRWYTRIPPGESILVRMFGCIGTALSGKCGSRSSGDKRDHWLDYAEPKYDKRFIADVKDVLSVCWLFIPLPIFWALFDQQGSRWTLQAKKLNGDFGGFVMQPDMMQVLNALLVVFFVPLLESLIYPCLDKFKIPNRPLQRMGWGMIFAATAFLMAGFLQIAIDNESPAAPGKGQIKYNVVNRGQCPVDVWDYDQKSMQMTLNQNKMSEYFYVPWDQSHELKFVQNCTGNVQEFYVHLDETKEQLTYEIMLNDASGPSQIFEQDMVDFTPDLQSTVRVYNALDADVTVKFRVGSNDKWFYNISSQNFSDYETFKLDDFSFEVFDPTLTEYCKNEGVSNGGASKNGAVYTLLLTNQNITANDLCVMTQLTDIPPRGINIFIQVPQYVVMTLGEVLFSVTGLGFAYSQASKSMKSILTACWLLTVAFGNVVVVIIAETGSSMKQTVEFFLFSGLMYVTTVIFVIMCFFYKYVEPRDDASSQGDATSVTAEDGQDTEKEGGVANTAFSLGDEKKALEGLQEQHKEEGKQASKEALPDTAKEQGNDANEEEEEDIDNHGTSF